MGKAGLGVSWSHCSKWDFPAGPGEQGTGTGAAAGRTPGKGRGEGEPLPSLLVSFVLKPWIFVALTQLNQHI